MSEWQDISTAPKDGTKVLLFIARLGKCIVVVGKWDSNNHAKKPRPYWTNDREVLNGVGFTRSCQPTHWQPLPYPPTNATP